MATPGKRSFFRWPYAHTPGSSTPGPETTPEEGTHELWAFFALALLNTAIIAVSGLTAFFIIHH